jgi:hypothetical protein
VTRQRDCRGTPLAVEEWVEVPDKNATSAKAKTSQRVTTRWDKGCHRAEAGKEEPLRTRRVSEMSNFALDTRLEDR